MISHEHWYDKLPEDRAAYYNRTRMSLEFFCQKFRIAPQVLLKEFDDLGYYYNAQERMFLRKHVEIRHRSSFQMPHCNNYCQFGLSHLRFMHHHTELF